MDLIALRVHLRAKRGGFTMGSKFGRVSQRRWFVGVLAAIFFIFLGGVVEAQSSANSSQNLQNILAADLIKQINGGQNNNNSRCQQDAKSYDNANKAFSKACGLSPADCISAYVNCTDNTSSVAPAPNEYGGYSASDISKLAKCPANGQSVADLKKKLNKNKLQIDKVTQRLEKQIKNANAIKNKMNQLQTKYQKDVAAENNKYQTEITKTLPQKEQKAQQTITSQITKLQNDVKQTNIKMAEIRSKEIDSLNQAANTCYQAAMKALNTRLNERAAQIGQATLSVQTQNDLWNQSGVSYQQREANYAYAQYKACLNQSTYLMNVQHDQNTAKIEIAAANEHISEDQNSIVQQEQQLVQLSQQNQQEVQQLNQTHNQNLQNLAATFQAKMQAEQTNLDSLVGTNSPMSLQQQMQMAIKSMNSNQTAINSGLSNLNGEISLNTKAGTDSVIGQLQLERSSLKAANVSILKLIGAESKAVADPKHFLSNGNDLVNAAQQFASDCAGVKGFQSAATRADKICQALDNAPADCAYGGGPTSSQNNSTSSTSTQSTSGASTNGSGQGSAQ